MERELIYLVIIICCFIQIAIMKICNTIFNINKMKYICEEKRIMVSKIDTKSLNDNLLNKIEIEVKKNENNK